MYPSIEDYEVAMETECDDYWLETVKGKGKSKDKHETTHAVDKVRRTTQDDRGKCLRDQSARLIDTTEKLDRQLC